MRGMAKAVLRSLGLEHYLVRLPKDRYYRSGQVY